MSNSSLKNDKGVSNDRDFRKVSDFLDDKFWKNGYKEESVSRAAVHACYHEGVACAKQVVGNLEGAAAERKRRQEQAEKMVENAKKHYENAVENVKKLLN